MSTSTQPSTEESLLSSSESDKSPSLAQYRATKLVTSLFQLGSTLAAFLISWWAMWYSYQFSYALSLLLAIPTAGFLVRLFVLQHDCGHGSFFRSKRANDIVGCLLGVITLTPYYRWRKSHAVHHATSGDLDRRGRGDVHMLTVKEYLQLSRFQRLVYRIHRHPLTLFGIGPFVYFAIMQRFAYEEPRSWKAERASVYCTNVALLACFLFMGWLIGFQEFLMIHLPVVALSSSAGVWLFYVQHHFEETYWQRRRDWNYEEAAIEGSSYYELPKILQWFTGSIGLHHIHHLDSHIPNYCLQKCFDENPEFQQVNRLTLRSSLSCATLKLWDEEQNKMVGYPRIKRGSQGAHTSN